jgi:glycosyltransferase involved in cell wall biosynthesis
MKKFKKGISIIIPVYREGRNVVETIEWIEREVRSVHEVLIAYETESEPSLPFILKWAIKNPETKLRLIKNRRRGLVEAMKTAFDETGFEAVVPIAADKTDDPTKLDEMYDLFRSGFAVVSGTRYAHGGELVGPKTVKSELSRTANRLVPWLMKLKLTDLTYAYKMYSSAQLSEIEIESTGGFEYAMELTLKLIARGEKVTEVPVRSVDRTVGVSKFKLKKWLKSYLKWYWWGMYDLRRRT